MSPTPDHSPSPVSPRAGSPVTPVPPVGSHRARGGRGPRDVAGLGRRARAWLAGRQGRRTLATGVSLALVATLAGAALAGDGSPPARFDLQSGGAWVASSRVGLLTLIDGETAEVVARVDVGDGSAGLVATQSGPVGYAVDGERGTVVRVDPRTFETADPVVAIARASGRVSARATASDLYLIDDERGRVVVTDPGHPRPETEAPAGGGDGGTGGSLAEAVGSSVVDGDGRLWVLGEASGDLVWFERGERHDRPAVTDDAAAAELVAVDGEPVLVDPVARSVRRVGADGGLDDTACLDIGAGDESLRFGGSHRRPLVFAVSGDQGVLRVSDLASGGCSAVAIPLFDPGDELGAPVEARGRVFVPNFTTGTVAVVDLDDEQVVVTDDPVADGTFELFDQDGIVFYNDRDSERAGVIHVDGTVAATRKYDPAAPDEGIDNRPRDDESPPEEAPPPPGEAEETQPSPPGADDPAPVPPGQPDQAASPPGGADLPPGPGGTRPARPDERPPAPGSSTTTSTSGTTPTPGPGGSTTSTTGSTTTTSSTVPPGPVCTGGDPDGDGVLDSCDPDDDGDGVPDESERCPGGNDNNDLDGDGAPDDCDGDDDNDGVPDGQDGCRGGNDNNDQDGDGVPDACDGSDGSPPSVSIDSVTRSRDGFFTIIQVAVSANDPQSGISSVSYTIQTGSYGCNDGSQWSGVTDQGSFGGSPHTFTFYIPCDAANGRPNHVSVFVTANATNGDGVSGSGQSGNYDP
jgi:hypothetical protein